MRLKQKIIYSILAGTFLAPLFSQYALATTGVIYITPASSSMQINSSKTLSLRINPGTKVDGVQATVTYSAASLRLNSVDTSSSPFSAQLQKSVSSGSITLALGNLSGGVSTDALIATMNFTALKSSGSTVLSISNANATSSGSYTNPAIANATISFTAPPPSQPAPSPSPSAPTQTTTTATSGGSSSGASLGGAVKAKPLSPPHITSTLAKVGYTSATLHVTSNRSLKLYATYGIDATHLTSNTVATSGTKTDIKLGDKTPLVPGTTYYYQVIGKDSDGKQTKLPIKHFTTTGFTVQVTVLGIANQPLANHTVELHSQVQTATTDAKGVATFTNVAPGEHHLVYKTNTDKEYSAIVYVANTVPSEGTKNTAAAPQLAAVILPVSTPVQTSSSRTLAIAGSMLLCIIIVAALLYLFLTISARRSWVKHSTIATLHLL